MKSVCYQRPTKCSAGNASRTVRKIILGGFGQATEVSFFLYLFFLELLFFPAKCERFIRWTLKLHFSTNLNLYFYNLVSLSRKPRSPSKTQLKPKSYFTPAPQSQSSFLQPCFTHPRTQLTFMLTNSSGPQSSAQNLNLLPISSLSQTLLSLKAQPKFYFPSLISSLLFEMKSCFGVFAPNFSP